MEKPLSYCEAVQHLEESNVHRMYHDTAYGFPIQDDDQLFERLVLEINQAGLSWSTILKKQTAFRAAYDQFLIKKVASYTQEDRNRLLNDAGIIRNRLKIDAAVHNARVILLLQHDFGSFKNWLDHYQSIITTKAEWVKLFKATFKFTGGEIVNEFLVSTGYLPGAHIEGCPIGLKIQKNK